MNAVLKGILFFHNLCMCVCFIFFTHTKAKTQNRFFLLGVGGNIFCKRDRWWVYWLLIIYTLLLPWQFFTLIYIFFKNVEIFKFSFLFPQVTKKFWKKILNIQENSIWLKWFFKWFIYLFDKHFLKLVTEVCYFFWVVGRGGGGGGGFFFFLSCWCVPTISQVIPQVFNVSLKDVPNSTWFQTHMFCPKSCPSHLYTWGVRCDGY